MSIIKKSVLRRSRRAQRVHTKIRGVSSRVRVAIFKSVKHFYAQIIDDKRGHTLCSCSTLDLETVKGDKKARARAVGVELAKRAQASGVHEVVLDRGGFLYHGRVKAFADGAREGGLVF